MFTPEKKLLSAVLLCALAACGGSTDDAPPAASGAGGSAGTGGSAGAGGGAPTSALSCPDGLKISSGLNSGVQIGEFPRSFQIDFPTSASKPPAVVFQWHGFGDTVANFRGALGLSPDLDPDLPLVLVTVDDLGLIPTRGLDWALFDAGAADDPNPDLLLFSSVAGCLIRDHGVDPARVYSVGFSAGAVMTNLVSSAFPRDVAATVAFSGAWFNDAPEAAAVNPLNFKITYAWPALDPASPVPVMITHGGPTDTYSNLGSQIIDFEKSAALAAPFLTAAGREVVDCAHTSGHTPDPHVKASLILQFFKDHPRGAPAAWKTTPPAALPASCKVL